MWQAAQAAISQLPVPAINMGIYILQVKEIGELI